MHKNTKILLTVALLLVSLTAVILYNSSTVFLQLFIAFALAYILNPAVVFLENRRVNRIVSILIVFSTALVVCTGFTIFLTISISGELSNMQLNLPAYARHLYEIIPATIKSYLGIETPDKLAVRLNDLFQQARGMSPDLLKPVLAFLQKAFSSTIGLILALLGYFIIPVYLFYLLADWPH